MLRRVEEGRILHRTSGTNCCLLDHFVLNHLRARKEAPWSSSAYSYCWLFQLRYNWLPMPQRIISGNATNLCLPRLRKRSSDTANTLPAYNDDWSRRRYEEWTACSTKVLQLIAMENSIALPPRADRARILFNHFQTTTTLASNSYYNLLHLLLLHHYR